MMVQLADAVNDLERWESGVALLLRGKGGNFCAGADLSLAKEHLIAGDDGRNMCALMTDTTTRLKRCVLSSNGGACARGQHRVLILAAIASPPTLAFEGGKTPSSTTPRCTMRFIRRSTRVPIATKIGFH